MLRQLWEAIATSKVVTGDSGSDMAALLTVIDAMKVVEFETPGSAQAMGMCRSNPVSRKA
jgi:hypothetical protein